jgi:hypothetical protein
MKHKHFLFGLLTVVVLTCIALFPSYLSKGATAYQVSCGMLLRDKLCFLDQNNVAECGLKESKFDVLEDRIASVFEHAPNQVKDKMCAIGAFVVAYPINGIEPWMGAFSNNEVIGINLALWQNISIPYELYEHDAITSYLGADQYETLTDASKVELEFSSKSEFVVGLNYSLAKMIFHEVGHLVEADLTEPAFHCLLDPASTKSLPLSTTKGDHYCFRLLPPKRDHSLIEMLGDSSFISYYATCTAAEDFAETYAAYLMVEHLGRDFTVAFGDQTIYASAQHLRSKQLEGKVDTIKAILNFGELTDAKKRQMAKAHENCFGRFTP